MKNREDSKIYFHYGTDKYQNQITQNDIFQIYNKCIDEESKRIFVDRLLFSMTNDWSFIRDMLIKTRNWSKIEDILSTKKEFPIYIYGAGISGKRPPLIFPDYLWKGYIDREKAGQQCNGLPIYGIEKCRELLDKAWILISNMNNVEQIKRDLIELGVPNINIISFVDCIKKIDINIYFDDECLKQDRMRGKVFIDAGAFDGADTIRFLNWTNDANAKAIVFEADYQNFEKTQKNLAAYSQVELYNQGISNIQEDLLFLSGKGEMSSICPEGEDIIHMNSLDNLVSDLEIGYIKMDIEGFEKQALLGAKEIISKQHPVLGISIYHKREDIWEIPKLILSLDPTYKFFLRHYSLGVVDTVLYAV